MMTTGGTITAGTTTTITTTTDAWLVGLSAEILIRHPVGSRPKASPARD